MNFKILGAILVITACGGYGFLIAMQHKKEIRYLRNLSSVLTFIDCELLFHLTPLPELCRQAGDLSVGILDKLFYTLSKELEHQISPDVHQCMLASISQCKELPAKTKCLLAQLGTVLGRFDLEGQKKGLDAIKAETKRVLQECSENQDVRIRSYQTLGVCAGAAVVILFI